MQGYWCSSEESLEQDTKPYNSKVYITLIGNCSIVLFQSHNYKVETNDGLERQTAVNVSKRPDGFSGTAHGKYFCKRRQIRKSSEPEETLSHQKFPKPEKKTIQQKRR